MTVQNWTSMNMDWSSVQRHDERLADWRLEAFRQCLNEKYYSAVLTEPFEDNFNGRLPGRVCGQITEKVIDIIPSFVNHTIAENWQGQTEIKMWTFDDILEYLELESYDAPPFSINQWIYPAQWFQDTYRILNMLRRTKFNVFTAETREASVYQTLEGGAFSWIGAYGYAQLWWRQYCINFPDDVDVSPSEHTNIHSDRNQGVTRPLASGAYIGGQGTGFEHVLLQRVDVQPTFESIPDRFAHTADFYAIATKTGTREGPPDSRQWFNGNETAPWLLDDQYTRLQQFSTPSATDSRQCERFPSNSQPPPSPPETPPPPGATSYAIWTRGWEVSDWLLVLNWAVDGGYSFID